jgi:predicted nucleotidyltransferase
MAVPLEPRLAAQRDAIAALCRTYGVTVLDVFGSAADGRFDPLSSDYDFIARFAPRDDGDSLGRRYVAFSEALESLLGRPVDVMTDHPIANPYLRAAVAASRRPFYVEPAAEASA